MALRAIRASGAPLVQLVGPQDRDVRIPRHLLPALIVNIGAPEPDILAEFKRQLREANLKTWRLHDIRRTVATRLGDLGVLPHVVEAILNHISGYRAGVAGIYNRSIVYAPEKRAALQKWAEHIVAQLGSADAIGPATTSR